MLLCGPSFALLSTPSLSHLTSLLFVRRKYFDNFHCRDLFVSVVAVCVGVVANESIVFELAGEMAVRTLLFRLIGVNEFGQQFNIDGFVDVRLSGNDFVETNIFGGGCRDCDVVSLDCTALLAFAPDRKYLVSLLNVDDLVRTCVGGPVDMADGETDSRARFTAKLVALWDRSFVVLVALSLSLFDDTIDRFSSFGRKWS